LQTRLSQHSFQPFPLGEVRLILQQVGEALLYAHQHHILHGALAPGAIFFTEDHHIVVTGFRFQSILAAIPNYRPEQEAHLPNTWYMAPEQFEGQLSEKSDQYTLGCLAYALLTGHVPFPGYTHATLKRKHQSEPLKLLTAYDPLIPANIEDAVLMALAKQPENRHESIQDFLRALEEPASQQIAPIQVSSLQAAALPAANAGSAATQSASPSPIPAVAWNSLWNRNSHIALAKIKNIQWGSKPLLKRKQLYIPALVLLILAIAIATTLSAFGTLSKHATHVSSISLPAPVKGARPSTPAPVNGQVPPATVAPTSTPITAPAPIVTAPLSCHIDYMITSQNNNGTFSANITIVNTSATNINGWTLAFLFPAAGQQITTIVSAGATFSQNNQQVIMMNVSFDGSIPAGQSLIVSIAGTWTNANPVPTSFTLNNTLCG
jgi:serine/threonine protein kinase